MRAARLRVFSAVFVLVAATAGLSEGAQTRIYNAASYKPGGDTGIDFEDTCLMPKASGKATISNKQGSVQIAAKFKGLEPARNFGTEFMTYVLWTVTPEGRVSNVGEIALDGASGQLEGSTRFQSFCLFVTAKPYFAVGMPSTKQVLENVFPEKTRFPVETGNTNSDLSRPFDYKPAGPEPMSIDTPVPSEVYQARNASRIAKWQQDDKYAPEAWANAQDALKTSETALAENKNWKTVAPAARVAVQTAEDARAMAVRKIAEEKAAAEKQAAADKLAAEKEAAADRLAAEQKAHADKLAAKQKAALAG